MIAVKCDSMRLIPLGPVGSFLVRDFLGSSWAQGPGIWSSSAWALRSKPHGLGRNSSGFGISAACTKGLE